MTQVLSFHVVATIEKALSEHMRIIGRAPGAR